jgi:hypothetical protein
MRSWAIMLGALLSGGGLLALAFCSGCEFGRRQQRRWSGDA